MAGLDVSAPAHWDHLAHQSEQRDYDAMRTMHEHIIFACAPARRESLLDLACGTGEVACAAAGKGWSQVVGCDFSNASLEVARKRCQTAKRSVDFVSGDVHALPFAEDTFDGAVCVRSWWVLRDRKRVSLELARVLRDGAEFVVQLWTKPQQNPLITIGAVAIGRCAPSARLPPDVTGPFQLTPELLFAEIRDAGFKASHAREEKLTLDVVDIASYWQLFRAVAGTAYAIYSALGETERARIDAEVTRRLQECQRERGVAQLSLSWWTCCATLN